MNASQECFCIYAKDQHGLGQIIMVSSNTTVMELADNLRLTLEKQQDFFLLKFSGKTLLNLFNTMSQEKIQQNSIVCLIGLDGSQSSEIFQYPISFCYKKQLYQIVVDINYSGTYLKEAISQILGLKQAQIEILCNDEIIENVKNIFEYGVLPYTQIYVQEKSVGETLNFLETKPISYSYYISRQTRQINQESIIEVKNAESGFIDDSTQCTNLSLHLFNLKRFADTTLDDISPITKRLRGKKQIQNIPPNSRKFSLSEMIQSCQSQPGDSLADRNEIIFEDLRHYEDENLISQNYYEIKFTDSCQYDTDTIEKQAVDPVWLQNQKGQKFKIQVKKNSTVSDIKSMLALYQNTQKQNLSLTSPEIQFSLDDNIELMNLNTKILTNLKVFHRA